MPFHHDVVFCTLSGPVEKDITINSDMTVEWLDSKPPVSFMSD